MFKIVSALFALLFLVGCGSTDFHTAPDRAVEATVSIEDIYVEMVKEDFPVFAGIDDNELIKMGNELCSVFEIGAPHTDAEFAELLVIYTDSMQGLLTTENALQFLAHTTVALCPEVTEGTSL